MTIADDLAAVNRELTNARAAILEAWVSAWILRYGTVPAICTDEHMATWLRTAAGEVPDWVDDQKLRDAAKKLPIGVSAHPSRFQLSLRTVGTTMSWEWGPISDARRAL